MRKILWNSNAPWAPTGYGTQTALFAPHLAEHFDLGISAFYGLDGNKLQWHGIPVYPGIGHDFGNIFLTEHARDHFGGDPRDGLIFTLQDVWPLDRDMIGKLKVASWCPVDHEPVPFGVANFFQASGAVPVAMSRYGEEQLKSVNLDPLYVPHGVDTNVFKPYDRDAVREEVGAPKDAFLIGIVAANKGRPSRKGFQQALEAFRIFREKHDEALLYLHTVVSSDYAAGEDILALARALGVEKSIVIAPAYRMMFDPFPASTMAQVYSAMDVLLNPAMGEGFGIPILEAGACGVPSIVTNFTAMPEVSGPAGWHVACRPSWTAGQSWMAIADVPSIVDALEICYGETETERATRSLQARSHAMQYDVKKVLEEHFLPALESCFERFEERKPSVSRRDLTTNGGVTPEDAATLAERPFAVERVADE